MFASDLVDLKIINSICYIICTDIHRSATTLPPPPPGELNYINQLAGDRVNEHPGLWHEFMSILAIKRKVSEDTVHHSPLRLGFISSSMFKVVDLTSKHSLDQ